MPKLLRIIKIPIPKITIRVIFCVRLVTGKAASILAEYIFINFVDIFAKTKVIETIPKDLANSTDAVDFKTPPSEILIKDPTVQWNILELAVGEEEIISYSVSKILAEFTQYIYWPLRQLNIISPAAPENFKLIDFNIPVLTPGYTSTLIFTIENPDTISHNFTFSMEVPLGWAIDPSLIEKAIASGEQRVFNVELAIPENAKTGRYIVRAIFGWDDNYVIKEYVADVRPPLLPVIFVYLFVAICLIAVVYSILKIIERRRRFMLRKKLITIQGELKK